jgi:hypothetical protein
MEGRYHKRENVDDADTEKVVYFLYKCHLSIDVQSSNVYLVLHVDIYLFWKVKLHV